MRDPQYNASCALGGIAVNATHAATIATIAGVIPRWCSFWVLALNQFSIQYNAAAAVAALARNVAHTHSTIIQCGAISLLVPMLESGYPSKLRNNAAFALVQLASSADNNRVAIGAAGAIPPLARMLLDPGSSTNQRYNAAEVLARLENAASIAGAGAIPRPASTAHVHIAAARAHSSLCIGSAADDDGVYMSMVAVPSPDCCSFLPPQLRCR
jgi:hypothetical protein